MTIVITNNMHINVGTLGEILKIPLNQQSYRNSGINQRLCYVSIKAALVPVSPAAL